MGGSISEGMGPPCYPPLHFYVSCNKMGGGMARPMPSLMLPPILFHSALHFLCISEYFIANYMKYIENTMKHLANTMKYIENTRVYYEIP